MNDKTYSRQAAVTDQAERYEDPELLRRLTSSLGRLHHFGLEFVSKGNHLDGFKRDVFYGQRESEWASSEGASERAKKEVAIIHHAVGIATEAAELLDAVCAHVFDGTELDRVNLVEEVGDLLWYEARLLSFLGTDFADAKGRNIAKLRKRFPDGFTELDAQERDLDAERAELEARGVIEVILAQTPGDQPPKKWGTMEDALMGLHEDMDAEGVMRGDPGPDVEYEHHWMLVRSRVQHALHERKTVLADLVALGAYAEALSAGENPDRPRTGWVSSRKIADALERGIAKRT